MPTVKDSAPPPSRRPPKNPAAAKREAIRLIVHERCPVEVFIIGDDGAHESAAAIEGVVFDITWKGIGLIVGGRLPSNTRVLVRLLSRSHGEEHAARVVWCSELPTSHRVLKASSNYTVRMGLEFLPASPDEKAALEKLALAL
jgi:hypothetical protein